MAVANWQRYTRDHPSPISGFHAQGKPGERDTGYLGTDGTSYSTSKHEFWGNRKPSNAADAVVWHYFANCWCNYPTCPGSRGGVADYGAYVRVAKEKASKKTHHKPRGTIEEEALKFAATVVPEGCSYVSHLLDPFKTRSGETPGVQLRVNFKHPDGRPDKDFRWMLPDGTWGLAGGSIRDLPPFGSEHLDEWVAQGHTDLWLVEGPKAAKAAQSLGLAVIALPGAGTRPSAEMWKTTVKGFSRLVPWPDRDETGVAGFERTADEFIRATGLPVTFFTWHAAPPKGDAANFVEMGLTRSDLDELIGNIDLWPDYFPASMMHPETLPAEADQPEGDPRIPAWQRARNDRDAALRDRALEVAAALLRTGDVLEAGVMQECKTKQQLYRCGSCGAVKQCTMWCQETLCLQCMPARLRRAMDERFKDALADEKYTLWEAVPTHELDGPNPIKQLRKRFVECRKTARGKRVFSHGVYTSMFDRQHGARILLALHDASGLPYDDAALDVFGGFEFVQVAEDMTYLQWREWWVQRHIDEILAALDEGDDRIADLQRWSKGRHRWTVMGVFDRPVLEHEMLLEPDENGNTPTFSTGMDGVTKWGAQVDQGWVTVNLSGRSGNTSTKKSPILCDVCGNKMHKEGYPTRIEPPAVLTT